MGYAWSHEYRQKSVYSIIPFRTLCSEIYLKISISITKSKDLNPSVDKICAEYFNSILERRRNKIFSNLILEIFNINLLLVIWFINTHYINTWNMHCEISIYTYVYWSESYVKWNTYFCPFAYLSYKFHYRSFMPCLCSISTPILGRLLMWQE